MKNNKHWAKALTAILGTGAICAAAYLTGNANCLWALILLIWLVDNID